jgi:tRNA(His) guanylyltransferase
MTMTRYSKYENSYSYNIIYRIPVILKINGRSFSRITKNTQKPFCHKTKNIFNQVILSLSKQIDGVVFGYQYSDKIFLVLRNDRSPDEDPWFGNNVQKIASTSASMATSEFMTQLWAADEAPNLEGNISFTSQVFGVPSIKETINYFIYQQMKCTHRAVDEAVYSILWPRYGNQSATILEGKDLNQRKHILKEAGLDFDSFPAAYRLGTATYLAPTLIQTEQGQTTRHNWWLDFNIPSLSKTNNWLRTIITTGSDIFRPERDYDDSVRNKQ